MLCALAVPFKFMFSRIDRDKYPPPPPPSLGGGLLCSGADNLPKEVAIQLGVYVKPEGDAAAEAREAEEDKRRAKAAAAAAAAAAASHVLAAGDFESAGLIKRDRRTVGQILKVRLT